MKSAISHFCNIFLIFEARNSRVWCPCWGLLYRETVIVLQVNCYPSVACTPPSIAVSGRSYLACASPRQSRPPPEQLAWRGRPWAGFRRGHGWLGDLNFRAPVLGRAAPLWARRGPSKAGLGGSGAWPGRCRGLPPSGPGHGQSFGRRPHVYGGFVREASEAQSSRWPRRSRSALNRPRESYISREEL